MDKEKLKERNRLVYENNKEEMKERVRLYRKNNPEKVRESRKKSDKKCANRIKEYYRKWSKRNPDKAWKKEWRKKNECKYRAHQAVFYAIKRGDLKKPSCCSQCGAEGYIEGHHEDYSKLLEVVWFCRICHVERHRVINDMVSV